MARTIHDARVCSNCISDFVFAISRKDNRIMVAEQCIVNSSIPEWLHVVTSSGIVGEKNSSFVHPDGLTRPWSKL